MPQIDEAAGNARHIEPKIPRCQPQDVGLVGKICLRMVGSYRLSASAIRKM
jgi:hypothetical protein